MTDHPSPKGEREPRRCPGCGYTEADKRLHLDHHLCPVEQKRRRRALLQQQGQER